MGSAALKRLSVAVSVGLGFASALSAAPVILPNVPDFFQHQGLAGNNEPYGLGWETAGGWCRGTGLADSLYSLRGRGYTNLLPAFNGAQAWRFSMADSIYTLRNLPQGAKPIKGYLAARGYSEFNGPGGQGLLVRQYITDGQSNTYYLSAYGRYVATGRKAINLYSDAITRGDAINVRLGGGFNADPARWWGNYHYLAGVGVDLASNQMFVADPDSNKGSLRANAGWARPPFPNQNDPAIRARAYTAADAFPVGPGALGPGFANYYGTMNMGAGNASAVVIGNDGGDNRYAGTVITGFETITPVRVGRNRRPSFGRGNEVVGDISINFEDDMGAGDLIDKIIVLPVDASPAPTFDDTMSDDDQWLDFDLPANFVDPLGEVRQFGGVEYDVVTDPNPDLDGLEANEVLSVAIATNLDYQKYDVLLHDAITGEWLVDPIGAPEAEFGDQLQVPEPSSMALAALAVGAMAARRRRRT